MGLRVDARTMARARGSVSRRGGRRGRTRGARKRPQRGGRPRGGACREARGCRSRRGRVGDEGRRSALSRPMVGGCPPVLRAPQQVPSAEDRGWSPHLFLRTQPKSAFPERIGRSRGGNPCPPLSRPLTAPPTRARSGPPACRPPPGPPLRASARRPRPRTGP